MKKPVYHEVLFTMKNNSIMYGDYDKHISSDYELCEYVLDIILNNPKLIFCTANYAIENIKYKINDVLTKHTVFVETKKYTFNSFMEFISSIKKRTIFGIHELYVKSINEIEIRFYTKEVPNEINYII